MDSGNMEDMLDILLKVQTLDDEIKETKLKIEKIPNKIAQLEKEIEKANLDVQEKNNRINEIKKTYKMREGDLAENEDKITKLNGQTFSVKTNEEYRAIMNEIDYLKKENRRIEDEMIVLLEEEEKLKAAMGKLDKETQDYLDKRNNDINNLRNEKTVLTEKQQQAEAAFNENFNKLPDDSKQIYKKITHVRGKAVCFITDTICTGCFANLTHQFLNELMKRNKIILCENCGRILIYGTPNK